MKKSFLLAIVMTLATSASFAQGVCQEATEAYAKGTAMATVTAFYQLPANVAAARLQSAAELFDATKQASKTIVTLKTKQNIEVYESYVRGADYSNQYNQMFVVDSTNCKALHRIHFIAQSPAQ